MDSRKGVGGWASGGLVLPMLILLMLSVDVGGVTSPSPSSTYTVDSDGVWSSWSVLSTSCSADCGGGKMHRVRTCTNPAPTGNGQLCEKETQPGVRADLELKDFPCNNHTCWQGAWSEWSNCTAECGRGNKTRYAMCGNSTCEGTQAKKMEMECNTWNKTSCPSPCDKVNLEKLCPDYAVCKDESDEKDPKYTCVCTMGYQMTKDNKSCVRPPPTTPTPRPIPTLEPAQKVVVTVVSKSASTVLIICVSICLAVFLVLRVFTPDRVIQMNMEIALLLAHVFLIFPPSVAEMEVLCRVVSIFIHFFFTACFMFMFLESLHMYAYVAYVIKQDGMFSRAQNIIVGWGVSAIIVLFCMCFEYHNYGATYHCWLQMDKPLLYGQLLPILFLVVLTFTMIEAAGAADYKPLKGMDKGQLTSARFSQRTNLIILPLVFSHMLVGMFSEFDQNLALYSIFTILNAVTGVAVLFYTAPITSRYG